METETLHIVIMYGKNCLFRKLKEKIFKRKKLNKGTFNKDHGGKFFFKDYILL